jgi:ClpP class serine protease
MKWLIEEGALSELKMLQETPGLALAARGPSTALSAAERGVPETRDGVARVSVDGPLMRDRSTFLDFFGVQHTAYSDLVNQIAHANGDPGVREIELSVNSPGGQVDGLFETVAAIQGSQKPVRAVAQQAASAAYALASSADSIEATGPGASFGSIGVVAEYLVSDDVVSVTSTNAPDKRPDVRTEEGRDVVRAQLDEIHDLFVGGIADGRGVSKATVNSEFGRGRMFLASSAKERGMIDSIRAVNGDSAGNMQVSATAEKESKMDLETLKAQHPDLVTAVQKEAVDKERDRVNAHLIMGEKCGALNTAITAVKEGTGMTETLRAEYMTAGLKLSDNAAAQEDDAELQGALETSAAPADDTQGEQFASQFGAKLKELQGKVEA